MKMQSKEDFLHNNNDDDLKEIREEIQEDWTELEGGMKMHLEINPTLYLM